MYTVKATQAPMTTQLQSNAFRSATREPLGLAPLWTSASGLVVVVVVMVTLALVIVMMRVLVVSVVVVTMMLVRDSRILAEHE